MFRFRLRAVKIIGQNDVVALKNSASCRRLAHPTPSHTPPKMLCVITNKNLILLVGYYQGLSAVRMHDGEKEEMRGKNIGVSDILKGFGGSAPAQSGLAGAEAFVES